MSGVDVVIPTWNCLGWIDACLRTVRSQSLTPNRVLVVDDASTDGTREWLQQHQGDFELIELEHHAGFAAAVNAGIEASSAQLVALLNADTEARIDWLAELVTALEKAPDRVASAASRMLQLASDDRIDNAGDCLSRYGSAIKRGHGEPADRWLVPGPVFSASAGAAIYRRELFDQIGGFDTSFESYLEDVDLGLRARLRGFDCLYVPSAIVLHQGGGSALPRARYVRLVTANRLALVVKNFPTRLIWRHLLRLAWGQIYFLVAYRRPWQSLVGYAAFLGRLRSVLRARQRVQAGRVLAPDALDPLLERELGEPTLRELARGRWGRWGRS